MKEIHFIAIILIYVAITTISIMLIVRDVLYKRRITIITLCKILYIITLDIVPIITYCLYLSKHYILNLSFSDKDIWTHYAMVILNIITYIMLNFGYRLRQKNNKCNKKKFECNIFLLMTILIIISICSLKIWSHGFGGINFLVTNANSIRAGFISSSNGTAFFKHFVPISIIVSFMAYNYIFIKKEKSTLPKKIYIWMIFVVSVIISCIYIIANDGRMLAGVYAGLFFLIYVKNEYEFKNKKMSFIILKTIFLFTLLMILIINADSIFEFVKGNKNIMTVSVNEKSIMKTIAQEFSFTIAGLQRAILSHVNGVGEYTIFNDIINGVFAWLPTSVKPIILTDVWDYNTILANFDVYGQSPTSIIAQSIYDLGYVGVFIIPCIYGIIIKKIENILSANDDNIFINTIYIVLGFYIAKGITYFSFYNIMINIFFIVISYIIYRALTIIKIR